MYVVRTDLMASLQNALEEMDVLIAPATFAPVWMFNTVGVNWVRVSNQEKRCLEAVFVEDGHGLFKLTPQAIVEIKRNERQCLSRLLLRLYLGPSRSLCGCHLPTAR
jgi:hypothetical protein